MLFAGVGVALVSLFDERGELDAPSTAELAGRLVEAGLKAVLVAGTTGEAATLGFDERRELVAAARKALPIGGPPLIAGTGAPSARQAVQLTQAALDEGADAVLVLSPPGAEDPRPYYDEVARAAGDAPVLAYHIPRASAPGIELRFLPELPVSGIKDSSGDAERALATVTTWDKAVYLGVPYLASFAGAIGCAGAILAIANAEPELCTAAFAGDWAAQLEIAKHRSAEARFPSGIKRLVAARWGYSALTRVAV
jgi:4-hydroxy-tetrahydrodipicolinate synthase